MRAYGAPYLKPIVVASNMPNIGQLQAKRPRDHVHEVLQGSVKTPDGWVNRTRQAGSYPFKLAQAMACARCPRGQPSGGGC